MVAGNITSDPKQPGQRSKLRKIDIYIQGTHTVMISCSSVCFRSTAFEICFSVCVFEGEGGGGYWRHASEVAAATFRKQSQLPGWYPDVKAITCRQRELSAQRYQIFLFQILDGCEINQEASGIGALALGCSQRDMFWWSMSRVMSSTFMRTSPYTT